MFTTNAYANDKVNVNVQPDTESIELDWEDEGHSYTIMNEHEGEEIWSGDQPQYTIDDLESDQIYQFILEIYNDEDELIDTAQINTSTLKNQQEMETFDEEMLSGDQEISYSMAESNLSTVASSDQVELQWENIPTDNNEYDILRDEEVIETVEGNEFVDDTVSGDEMHRYTVKGQKKVPEERVEEIEAEIEENEEIQLSEEEKEQALYEPKEASVVINASEGDHNSPSASTWLLRYTTFIPMEYAENPSCFITCTYEYFGGDDRGFGEAGSFRTRSDVVLNEDLEELYHFPDTGITYGYDEDYNEIDQAQADAEEDHDITTYDQGDFSHRMDLGSANPLLSYAPDIDAYYVSNIIDGLYAQFQGSHDQAPSHEFYFDDRYGNSVTIHTAEHQGFHHLIPGFPNASFITNVYYR
ncbi:DUF3238 domain-containing protein [Salicibibacter kimchii]|uniref:DUF3238 domain-containing protein n=1 Tax=Salicibibacter kimchii TaxID=2099786 RepID=A0A345C0M3_9BACI|nr:DUF3238 domain-containing protein [Salicibibacter kimchii]AXF56754.1 DUF3238 domain-containing protein [Salicibibacter kimchii]